MSVAASRRWPPFTSTFFGPSARIRRAASSMSRSVATGIPASASASWRFGVTSSASGSNSLTSAARASGCRSGSPDLAIITGSSTIFPSRPCARSRSATSPMIAAVESMPIFTASASKSERTESIYRPTNSGGRLKTPWTPSEFWAVTAVITLIPNTRNAEKVLRSAWMPAPPPESEPAMVRALGTLITARSIPPLAAPSSRIPVDDLLPCAGAPTSDRRDDQGELAARLGGGEAGDVGGGGRPHDLFELLGELARHHQLDVAVDLADRAQGRQDAMGRLVDHHRRLELSERLEALDPPAGLHRQEAVEHEAVGGHTRSRKRGDDGRRPRNRHDREPGGARLAHQQDARVGDARRTGVGHQRDRAPGRQLAHEREAARQLVVLVVADRRLVDV